MDEKVELYLICIQFFLDSFKAGLICEITFLQIEKKICEKIGLNPLSVFRYTKGDLDAIIKDEMKKQGLNHF